MPPGLVRGVVHLAGIVRALLGRTREPGTPSEVQIQIQLDLTCQHKNQTLLVEGPEITIRPVGTRRVTAGSR